MRRQEIVEDSGPGVIPETVRPRRRRKRRPFTDCCATSTDYCAAASSDCCLGASTDCCLGVSTDCCAVSTVCPRLGLLCRLYCLSKAGFAVHLCTFSQWGHTLSNYKYKHSHHYLSCWYICHHQRLSEWGKSNVTVCICQFNRIGKCELTSSVCLRFFPRLTVSETTTTPPVSTTFRPFLVPCLASSVSFIVLYFVVWRPSSSSPG